MRPVGAVVQGSLQPLDRSSLQGIGYQRHQMSGQAAAALRSHGVPLVGHGAGPWGTTHRPTRWRSQCSAGRGFCVESVPICSFSNGSSTSFRLASRRMSVQICRQIKTHARRRQWPQEDMRAFLDAPPASAAHLVDSRPQTGQAGQAVDVHLTAVRLSGHQVGPVARGIKESKPPAKQSTRETP